MTDYQSYGAYQGGESTTGYSSQSQPVADPAPQQQNFGGSANFGNFNPQESAGKAKDPKVITRLVGWLCALVVFACASNVIWRSDSTAFSAFLIFVAVMAWLFDMFFIVYYLIGERFPPMLASKLPVIEFGLSAVWTLFWFASATAYATKVNTDLYLGAQSTINGTIVFAYFCMVIWGIDTFLAFKRFRENSGGSSLPYSSV